MTRIAEKVGIGRATLYKYFPDVEAILTAYHERNVTSPATLNGSPNFGTTRAAPVSGSKRHSSATPSSLTIAGGTEPKSSRHSCTEASLSPMRSSGSSTFSETFWSRSPPLATCETTSRPTNSRVTDFTPCPEPASCRPKPQSADSSRSR
ncbi:TetR/AcrR family transcriptional regulator [Nonomuraea jabiensis]|uniref:TetR/AcrR family transcriptional regulator n=1 Tax=Nonomuraea jabiensis TaxID=882448 RepID=UPI0035E404E5